jgi:hypothetical protein
MLVELTRCRMQKRGLFKTLLNIQALFPAAAWTGEFTFCEGFGGHASCSCSRALRMLEVISSHTCKRCEGVCQEYTQSGSCSTGGPPSAGLCQACHSYRSHLTNQAVHLARGEGKEVTGQQAHEHQQSCLPVTVQAVGHYVPPSAFQPTPLPTTTVTSLPTRGILLL